MDVFGPTDIAKICHVTRVTVYRWLEEKRLKSFQTGGGHHRVHAKDLAKFLKSIDVPIPKQLRSFVSSIILIVDDENPIRRLIIRLLKKINPKFEVHEATDGYQAGHMVRAMKPNLVVLDLMLPGIDGMTVCKMIRKDPKLESTKILAISGRKRSEVEKKILKAGANFFLAKPFSNNEFIEAANKLIS